MRAVVTGCAGFIGSTLVDVLRGRDDDVVGIDCFTPYYDETAKRANLPAGFEPVEADLRQADLAPLLDGADVVFHLAAQPGVRLSWADGFDAYAGHNVLATQRVLEAAVAAGVERVVYASSSSIYGQAARYPCHEDDRPAPFSPYGVTKLAGEHLCQAYVANHGITAVQLRYFTVFGPRQRPDMAFHRIFEAALADEPFPLYGDGSAVRDFTFVDDVVAATLTAATATATGSVVCNVAGGSEVSMAELLDMAGEAVGRSVRVDRRPPQLGDVTRTGGSIERTKEVLGWAPEVSLEQGLARQAEWHRRRRAAG